MLYLVGLGLGDVKDITIRGLEVVKKADRIYLEAYTSLLAVDKDELELFYGRKIITADREMVEMSSDEILEGADDKDVAFLVVGDPLGATTHSDLIIRAVERGIPYQVVHNASIMNAVGCCGLQLYRFGETVSIPLWTQTWKPDSFIDKIVANLSKGLHTLCLLDIKVKELSMEQMMKGKMVYEAPRFMTVKEASSQIMDSIAARNDPPLTNLSASTRCVGLARIGTPTQIIGVSTLAEIGDLDMGKPLHSLVIIGDSHPLEDKMLSIVSNASKVKQ